MFMKYKHNKKKHFVYKYINLIISFCHFLYTFGGALASDLEPLFIKFLFFVVMFVCI